MRFSYSRMLVSALSLFALGGGLAWAQPNLLANYEFDTGLSGWTRYQDRPAHWEAQDLFERPASGSVLLSHEEALAGGNYIILQQCLPITAPGGYRVSGWIRNLPDQGVPGNASIIVQPARNADCSGGFGNVTGPAASSGTNWQYREWDFSVSHATVPWQAIMVSLAVQKAQAVTTPRRARFDHIALRRLGDPPAPVSIFVQRSGNGVGRVVSTPVGIDCGSTCVHGFAPGTVLRLDAEPQPGYAFTRWTGGPCVNSANPVCMFIVEQSDTAGAEFTTQQTLSVLFDGAGSGRVTSAPAGVDCTGPSCLVPFPTGTTVVLTATAEAGSRFAGWLNAPQLGDCAGSAPTCTLAMTQARIARPLFELLPPVEHTLTVTVHGAGGGLVESTPGWIHCPSLCSDPFLEGTAVTLTATPINGSAFDHWEGDCTGTAPTCELAMDAPRVARAHFRLVPPPALDVLLAGDGSGQVTGSPGAINCPGICSGGFAIGTPVTLTATAAVGSTFGHWEGDCTGTAPTCTLTMDGDRTALAVFIAEPATYRLDVIMAGTGHGRILSAPAGIDCPGNCSHDYPPSTLVTLTPHPEPGYVFTGWQGACEPAGTGPCTVTMSEAFTVTTLFGSDDDVIFRSGFE